MTETIHCTVLKEGDIEIRDGRLRITLWGEIQEFNIEPAVMVSVGFDMASEGHRKIMEDMDRKDSLIEALWERVHEYEAKEGEQ